MKRTTSLITLFIISVIGAITPYIFHYITAPHREYRVVENEGKIIAQRKLYRYDNWSSLNVVYSSTNDAIREINLLKNLEDKEEKKAKSLIKPQVIYSAQGE